MINRKRKSFSESVLELQRDQRWLRIKVTVVFMAIAVCYIAEGLSLYSLHLKEKAIAKINAPTWADFVALGPGSVGTAFDDHVAAETQDGIPAELVINGEVWSVVRVDHFNDADDKKPGEYFNGIQAQTFCAEKTIAYIRAEDQRRLHENIWHEIFHAAACSHGGDTWWNSENPTEDEHPGIYHLGEFMSIFSHDNPRFVEWEKW